jgi:hypothetical protein
MLHAAEYLKWTNLYLWGCAVLLTVAPALCLVIAGRGGWVWTRNFELDSVAYFFNFLWNFYATPSIWRPEQLLGEALVHDAVVLMLKVLEIEQHHEEKSPYRYSELAREGLGSPIGYTGMMWGIPKKVWSVMAKAWPTCSEGDGRGLSVHTLLLMVSF